MARNTSDQRLHSRLSATNATRAATTPALSQRELSGNASDWYEESDPDPHIEGVKHLVNVSKEAYGISWPVLLSA
jgi:hypothetical protein